MFPRGDTLPKNDYGYGSFFPSSRYCSDQYAKRTCLKSCLERFYCIFFLVGLPFRGKPGVWAEIRPHNFDRKRFFPSSFLFGVFSRKLWCFVLQSPLCFLPFFTSQPHSFLCPLPWQSYLKLAKDGQPP